MIERQDFQAPWYARGGQLQTVLGFLLPSPRLTEAGNLWLIPLADGDRLAARVHEPTALTTETLILFHGLGGDIDSNYMHRTALIAAQMGWRTVRVNLRAAGEGMEHASGVYHSARAADLSEVMTAARTRWPESKMWAIGFSLSGNLVLNLLSRNEKWSLPDGAISVNPAMDLAKTAVRLQQGMQRLYDSRFVKDMRLLVKSRQRRGLDKDFRWPRGKINLQKFDDIYTAPVAGFQGAQEYYRECSSVFHVSKIKTPTVVITAKDDPFVPVQSFEEAAWSKSTRVTIASSGGHIGYVMAGANSLGTNRWIDEAIQKALLQLSSAK